MAELTDPVETGMPRSVKYGIVTVLVVLVFMWLLPRRTGNNGAPPATGSPGAPPTTAKTTDRETERQLTAILRGLSPDVVVISSDRLDRVTELGQWAGESLTKGDAASVTFDEAVHSKWFSGPALTEVNDASFSLRDGHHITLAELAGDIATKLLQRTLAPVEQVDDLFRFVVRETMLMPDVHDQQLPGTPLEALVLGRSTAARRAWTMGVLLRQLRIDAVILEPKAKPEAWLIGVITPEGEVLLYDPRLGTGVPSAPGPQGFETPASLSQVKQQPELLRELDLPNAAYPLEAKDLSSLNVRLITDSSTGSLRMAKLQTMVTGRLMVVFDGMTKNPLAEQGLADRVIAAGARGHWSADDVSVWDYPEEQSEAFMSSGAENSPAWEPITRVFLGPVALTQVRRQTKNEGEAATETVVQRSKEPLRLIRLLQLKWEPQEAIRGYLPIRTASRGMSMLTRDPELQEKLAAALPRNAKAADFANFWTAACQSQINPKLTPGTLKQYLRDFPQGEMIPAVVELWATSLVEAGDKPAAVALLSSGQRTPRLDILLKKWQPAKPAEETKPTETAPEIPATPMPAAATEPPAAATPSPVPTTELPAAATEPADPAAPAPAAADGEPPAPPTSTSST